MILSNVDLPQPDGPIKATISPREISMSMPFRTSSLLEPEPNPFINPLIFRRDKKAPLGQTQSVLNHASFEGLGFMYNLTF
jgi:hypothetical protein